MNKDNEQREIKFRMWTGTKMLYDISNVYECLKQQKAHDEGLKLGEQIGVIPYDHVSDDSRFLQFTGFQDKFGTEIFEHDLVKRNGHTYKVTFESGGFCLTGPDFMPLDQITIMHHDRFLNNFMPDVEVIGHIYSSEPIVK